MQNPFENRNYKFGSEGFLSMYMSSYQFILGADLEQFSKDRKTDYNLYFILKRPKVSVDPESFVSKGNKANFSFKIHQQDGFSEIQLGIELKEAKSELDFITEYPYDMFGIADQTKPLIFARPGSLIDSELVLNNINTDILDYEVLYVGQAYGKKGSREATERLSSHQTLQKIYTHSLTQNPDCDIWILFAEFTQVSMLMSLSQDLYKKSPENKNHEQKLIENFFENNGLKFTEKQKINFTEGALIKYFEPKYNIELKNSFPSEKHKSYSECYNLDIRALSIELDTSEMIRKLFSEKAPRKSYHSKMFEFKNTDERISILEMNNKETL
tara:strand:+ start:124 stop:1107 length:984 start_codon:yes stop_codon:yes gene_type:complete